MAKSEHLGQIRKMLLGHRWVALATVDEQGLPAASMVACAPGTEEGVLYLHLSGLAAHTRELRRQPRASLVLGECDTGEGDPQQLARLTLHGRCSAIAPDDIGYAAAKGCYLRRLPDAERLFGFGDFILFRFEMVGGRFVGGFGQAHSYSGEELRQLLRGNGDE